MTYQPPAADSYQQAAWIAFARTEGYTQISAAVPGLIQKIGYKNPDQFHETMARCIESQPDEILRILLDPEIIPSISARELGAAFFIRRIDFEGISYRETAMFYRVVSPYIPIQSPFHGYAFFHECNRMCRNGSARMVPELLESRIDDCRCTESGVISIWQEALFSFLLGLSASYTGDFKTAHRELAVAYKKSVGLDFSCAISIQYRLAQLYRESGQYTKALEIWAADSTRSQMKIQRDWGRLAAVHLNAAQCALDGKLIDVAQAELEASKALMPLIVRHIPRLQGYQYLREGELATLEERYDDGEARLKQALDFFRDLDPPCSEGLMETKVALGSYALYQNDLRMAWAIIRSLIEEAGERDCLPMRSRALLLQTWFFISSDPPTRASFDNVLERVHMIQNPALLMHALGNLLSYAVKHLEESDQVHLLHRIRSLRTMLEESCYEKLYQHHVADRFAPAMEERFDRLFGEQDPETTMETH